MELSPFLFWDTDYEKIDWDKSYSYVIEKVVTYGSLKDWDQIKRYYGLEKIKETSINLRNLDSKTLNFLSFYFKIPMDEFRCYKFKQSIPTHYPS